MGYLADLGFERRWELVSLRGAYTRTITYGLSATPIETDKLTLGQRYRLSPRLVEEATGQVSLARRIIADATDRYARYGEATLKFIWLWMENVQLGAAYSLEMYRSDDPDRDITEKRHRGYVTFEWNFDLLD